MTRVICLLVSCFLFSSNSIAGKLTGTVSLAVNSKSTFLNFYGPGVRYSTEEYSFGAGFFPSLRYDVDNRDFSPALGIGPVISRGQYTISLPSYLISGTWYSAVGIGIMFQ